MLTHTPAPEQSDTTASGDRPAAPAVDERQLRLRMDFTDPQLVMLTAAGELDTVTTPRLTELLWPRLQSTLTTLVLDLSEVTFLGVAGLELLANAHTYATHRSITLCLINSTPTVTRALSAAELDTTLPCFASVTTARTALTGQASTTPVA